MEDGGQLGTPEEATGFSSGGEIEKPVAPRRVDKPWGFEVIWAETAEYVGKLLHVHAGHSLSLQFHEEKDETLHLLEGEVVLELGMGTNSMERVDFTRGTSLRIRPGTLHRLEAVSDATILEASTTELDDVVRVSDRYGRAGEGPGDAG